MSCSSWRSSRVSAVVGAQELDESVLIRLAHYHRKSLPKRKPLQPGLIRSSRLKNLSRGGKQAKSRRASRDRGSHLNRQGQRSCHTPVNGDAAESFRVNLWLKWSLFSSINESVSYLYRSAAEPAMCNHHLGLLFHMR